ncbi:fimbria/pilus periplasmic chaperone [Caenimonas terrae]|uniref:Fimbria/pilus periplasmic chaperone n=1 Tax=Caenimonas terrae TaxID=696074 RepID=A0ABW0NED9_9BURK
MRPWLLSIHFAAAIAAASPLQAIAYTMTPSQVTLLPSGGGASTFLRLENKEARPAAVEITVQEHRKDLDGKTLQGAPADEDFIVYPAQIVMLPGDEVAVQVRWIGAAPLAAERAYTLVAREVPIPRPAQEPDPAGGVRLDIRVQVNYEARIYVTPAGAKPRVVVESVAERSADSTSPAAGPQLEIILANEGTAHQALTDLTLRVVPLDPAGVPLRQQAVSIPAREVPAMRPHLLAGQRRRLLVPRPAGLPAGPVQVLLSP